MSISNIFGEYADVEAQIAALELKKEQLKPFIIKKMLEDGKEKVDIGVGKFSLSIRKKWTYPESVIAKEEELKAAKATAESTGDATFEEFDQLRYTSTKL